MIIIILNYILFILKLILFGLLVSIPITFIVFIFKKKFKTLNKKKSFFASLFILIYIVMYMIILIIYFIPFIINGFNAPTLWILLQDIIINLIRLLFVNLLLSAIILVLGFITVGIYELLINKIFNKKSKKKIVKNKDNNKKLNFIILWLSITETIIISFIIYLIFPQILSLLIYIIYF